MSFTQEETENEVSNVNMTEECHDVSKDFSSSTKESKEKGNSPSEKTNKEVSVVDATKSCEVSIVKEAEGCDQETKENKENESPDTLTVKVTKMQLITLKDKECPDVSEDVDKKVSIVKETEGCDEKSKRKKGKNVTRHIDS